MFIFSQNVSTVEKKKALNFDSVGKKCGMFDLSLK